MGLAAISASTSGMATSGSLKRFTIPETPRENPLPASARIAQAPRVPSCYNQTETLPNRDGAWHVTEAAVLSATLLYVGPWRDVSRSGTVTGLMAKGYTLVNLAASYDLGNGPSAYGRIDNLFDRGYQNPIGF